MMACQAMEAILDGDIDRFIQSCLMEGEAG